MQTKNKQRPGIVPTPEAANRDARVAQRYKAILPARLALMRWTHGGNIPHIAATARLPAQRAAWYDQLQRDLLAWFAAGGFHAPAAASSGEAKTADEPVQGVVPK